MNGKTAKAIRASLGIDLSTKQEKKINRAAKAAFKATPWNQRSKVLATFRLAADAVKQQMNSEAESI